MEHDDVEVTEIVELQATKVSGVGSPANGTPFLMLKAAKADDEEDDGKGIPPAVQDKIDAKDKATKDLSAADREKMPNSSFAFIDKHGGKHLPIHDEGHVIAAKGRIKNQDFSEAKTSADAAKAKAEARIDAKAKSLGIGKPEEGDAEKGSVQDGLDGTEMPKEAGHLSTGQSSLAGPVTTGVKPVGSTVPSDRSASSQPGVTGSYEGGEATVEIPAEAKVITNPVYKVAVVGSLVEAINTLDRQRTAIKEGKYLQSVGSVTEPDIPLTEVASTLATCVRTLEQHLMCERVEAAVDPTEQGDVWDMEDAKCALESALRLVANIAIMESLEDEAVKNLDVDQLVGVRATLDEAVAFAKANDTGSAGDKETIHMDVTKEELAETIAASTVIAVEAALKAKAGEKAEKKAKKEKAAAEEAEKNANNGGDISESEIKPTKEVDSDDINAVKGEGDELDPATKQVADQLEVVTKGLESLQETVAKFAKRPRSGGPSLDGQARGAHPAAEGRQSDQVTKSEADTEIEKLEKSLADETDPLMKDELGRKLTYARLIKMHETGQL